MHDPGGNRDSCSVGVLPSQEGVLITKGPTFLDEAAVLVEGIRKMAQGPVREPKALHHCRIAGAHAALQHDLSAKEASESEQRCMAVTGLRTAFVHPDIAFGEGMCAGSVGALLLFGDALPEV